jgi:hypothetical protein
MAINLAILRKCLHMYTVWDKRIVFSVKPGGTYSNNYASRG